MSQHDLFDFFKNANEEIEKEYKRIYRRVREDPGTAGDQGEENWKNILEMWVPPYFQIVTKGRILGDNGETSPQIDILVLSPDYPKQLLGCKQYLAGGVLAAFECKTTLRREDIEDFFEHSKKISALVINEKGTPRKDLVSKIYYGLLAHSHEWKRDHSKPKENINNAIYEFDGKIINHPIEMPSFVCVADVGTWHANRFVIPPQRDTDMYKELTVMSAYVEANASEDYYTPIGAMLFHLLEYLSWDYPSLRSIVKYMNKLNVEGGGQGHMRPWNAEVLSPETRSHIHQLKNGGFWNEWGMSL